MNLHKINEKTNFDGSQKNGHEMHIEEAKSDTSRFVFVLFFI